MALPVITEAELQSFDDSLVWSLVYDSGRIGIDDLTAKLKKEGLNAELIKESLQRGIARGLIVREEGATGVTYLFASGKSYMEFEYRPGDEQVHRWLSNMRVNDHVPFVDALIQRLEFLKDLEELVAEDLEQEEQSKGWSDRRTFVAAYEPDADKGEEEDE